MNRSQSNYTFPYHRTRSFRKASLLYMDSITGYWLLSHISHLKVKVHSSYIIPTERKKMATMSVLSARTTKRENNAGPRSVPHTAEKFCISPVGWHQVSRWELLAEDAVLRPHGEVKWYFYTFHTFMAARLNYHVSPWWVGGFLLDCGQTARLSTYDY